ncbi:MAG TPA: DUF4157 domain-containing protein, partial [Kofleriaceae bacterium]
VHAAAARGTATPASALPHADVIQRLFGRHDVSGVQAHVGPDAAATARDMGGKAYATGSHVVLGSNTDLFTTAHEAAHIVQQRSGVSLLGGVDRGAGDPHEQHANAVAEKVVRGESAEALLDQYRGGGGGGAAVQRFGNEAAPEDPAITAIHAGAATPQAKLAALEASNAPELRYGVDPRTDEEAEVTGSASYLQEKKRDWRAELQSRNDGNAPNWTPQENFQYEMNRATPGVNPNQPPWFMHPGYGYQVTGGNVDRLNAVAAHRANPAPDDPQQQLGMTYQRDTMYTIETAATAPIQRHQAAFDAATPAATVQGWVNDVLRLTAAADELRLRITAATDGGAGNVTVSGTVLPGPVSNGGLGVGSAAQVRKTQATGVVTLHDGAGTLVHTVASGTWNGKLESYAYHQARTRINEGLGMHVAGAGAPEARNRGAQPPLDDATFNTVAQRHANPAAPERGYAQTLGPARTRLNFHDAPGGPHEVGWDINVAPYRRLGGDTIFQEAAHPAPTPYQNQLQPASTVNVNDPAWYYNQQNAMPHRFVGGRSNSTGLYMSSATMLFHAGRLSIQDAADVLAFVIADMVVSGEHSMPECMTTVVMAAGSAEPWTATPLNLAAATPTLRAWLLLVNPATQHAMLAEARASLLRLLANPAPDPKMVKVLTMLVKAL